MSGVSDDQSDTGNNATRVGVDKVAFDACAGEGADIGDSGGQAAGIRVANAGVAHNETVAAANTNSVARRARDGAVPDGAAVRHCNAVGGVPCGHTLVDNTATRTHNADAQIAYGGAELD